MNGCSMSMRMKKFLQGYDRKFCSSFSAMILRSMAFIFLAWSTILDVGGDAAGIPDIGYAYFAKQKSAGEALIHMKKSCCAVMPTGSMEICTITRMRISGIICRLSMV